MSAAVGLAGASYAQAGRGSAVSTDATLRYSKIYFDNFATSKRISTFDELIADDREDILCHVPFWREFATWLHSHGRQISNNEKYIEQGAALNYLSALTTACTRKWPTHTTWQKNSFDTWYQEIRKDIVCTIGRREIRDGDDGGEELQAIDLKTLMKLNKMWNVRGNQDGMFKATAVSLSYFGMGRSGEFAFLTGESLTFTLCVSLYK